MTDPLLKCTTRHIRIFTAVCENDNLVEDGGHLTMDLDPDNEFLWEEKTIEKVQKRFSELVEYQADKELSDLSELLNCEDSIIYDWYFNNINHKHIPVNKITEMLKRFKL